MKLSFVDSEMKFNGHVYKDTYMLTHSGITTASRQVFESYL